MASGRIGSGGRVEALATNIGGTRKFRREPCVTCAKETLFQGLKCLNCGICKKIVDRNGEPIKYDLKSVNGFYFKRRNQYKRAVRSIRGDKSAYLHAQAEESRKKFEGSK